MTDRIKSYRLLAMARRCAEICENLSNGYEREKYSDEADSILMEMNNLLARMSVAECNECLIWTARMTMDRVAP